MNPTRTLEQGASGVDVRAVNQATSADAGAVGADEVRVVGARAAGLLALAPDAALDEFDDHRDGPPVLRLGHGTKPLCSRFTVGATTAGSREAPRRRGV